MNKYMEHMLLQAREVKAHNDEELAKVIVDYDYDPDYLECPFCTADSQEASFTSDRFEPDCKYCPLLTLAGDWYTHELIRIKCETVGAKFLKAWEESCE